MYSINFSSHTEQKNKTSLSIPVALGLAGVGLGGGYGAYKLAGNENVFDEFIQQETELANDTIKFSTDKLTDETMNKAYDDKYWGKIRENDELHNKYDNEKLKPEDFLDKSDLELYKSECEKIKENAKNELDTKISKHKKELKNTKNKFLLIGAGIGVLLGGMNLFEKFLNKKNDKKSNTAFGLAGGTILGGGAGALINHFKINEEFRNKNNEHITNLTQRLATVENGLNLQYTSKYYNKHKNELQKNTTEYMDILNELDEIQNSYSCSLEELARNKDDTMKQSAVEFYQGKIEELQEKLAEIKEKKEQNNKRLNLINDIMEGKTSIKKLINNNEFQSYKKELYEKTKDIKIVNNNLKNQILKEFKDKKSKILLISGAIGAGVGLIAQLLIRKNNKK